MNKATINVYLEPLKELISILEDIEEFASGAADEARMETVRIAYLAVTNPYAMSVAEADYEVARQTTLAEGHTEMALAAAVASTRIRGLFV